MVYEVALDEFGNRLAHAARFFIVSRLAQLDHLQLQVAAGEPHRKNGVGGILGAADFPGDGDMIEEVEVICG